MHANDFNAHGRYTSIDESRTEEDLTVIFGFVSGAEIVIEAAFKKAEMIYELILIMTMGDG